MLFRSLKNNYEIGTPEWTLTEYQNKFSAGDYESVVSFIAKKDLDSLKLMFDEIVKFDTTKQLLLTLFPGIKDSNEFINLPSDKFMVYFLDSFYRLNPELLEAQLNVKIEIIGKLFENKNLVHILTRNTRKIGEENVSIVVATSLKKINGKWYRSIQDGIIQVVHQLKKNIVNH